MKIEKKNKTCITREYLVGVAAAIVMTVAAGSLLAEESGDKKQAGLSTADTTNMTLKGGEEGTLFESLRIEGEDRVRVRFERPTLRLAVDAGSAPGLDWKSIHHVIDRSGVDPLRPFLARSAGERAVCYTRPWLNTFSTGGIAHFRPALEGVDRWRLLVADSKGNTVAEFEGKGKPPKDIAWDGRSLRGGYVPPGLVYSYVLEAYDRAGNKRNFVGEGFELSAYRIDTEDGHTMLFSGSELLPKSAAFGEAAPPPAILLEIASWLNQEVDNGTPVRVEISARDFRGAKHLADEITRQLSPLLLWDPVRIQTVTNVETDAPEHGSVALTVSR